MQCPYCSERMDDISRPCPHCGRMPHFGGNTTFFEHAQKNTLSLSEIFSDVFKKHSHQDLVSSLLRQPNTGAKMLSAWHKPWLFFRLFAFLFLISLALYSGISQPYAFNMYITIGCMVVPLSLMVFIWELDIHSNVSIFDMMLLLFFGGILSLSFAFNLNTDLPASYYAGFTEEPSKLAVCILFIVLNKRQYYALDGLAIGAAVGAGFAFMESIQYVYLYNDVLLVINRGIRALSSHILYAAPAAGMLAHAMNGHPFKLHHLTDKAFLRVFACCILSHAINNADFTLMVLVDSGWLYLSLKDVFNTLFIWSVFLYVVRCGVRQALSVQSSAASSREVYRKDAPKATLPDPGKGRLPQPEIHLSLCCTSGEFAHRSFPLPNGRTLTLGRDPSRCQIRFHSSTISSCHCRIRLTASGVELCDLNSKNGTYVNGKRLAPGQPVPLRRGDTFALYKEQFIIR